MLRSNSQPATTNPPVKATIARLHGGEVYVIKPGPQFELLSKNLLGEIAVASPAVSENALYYRTRGHVVAIAER